MYRLNVISKAQFTLGRSKFVRFQRWGYEFKYYNHKTCTFITHTLSAIKYYERELEIAKVYGALLA